MPLVNEIDLKVGDRAYKLLTSECVQVVDVVQTAVGLRLVVVDSDDQTVMTRTPEGGQWWTSLDEAVDEELDNWRRYCERKTAALKKLKDLKL